MNGLVWVAWAAVLRCPCVLHVYSFDCAGCREKGDSREKEDKSNFPNWRSSAHAARKPKSPNSKFLPNNLIQKTYNSREPQPGGPPMICPDQTSRIQRPIPEPPKPLTNIWSNSCNTLQHFFDRFP